jgi:hypothetical protein
LNIDPKFYKPAIGGFYTRYTALAIDYHTDTPNPIGSGVFANICGQPMVLTARHVWNAIVKAGQPKFVSVFLTQQNRDNIKKALFIPRGIVEVPTRNGVDLDMVAVLLGKNDIQRSTDIFIAEELIGDDIIRSDYEHIVAGFPTELIQQHINPRESWTQLKLLIWSTDVQKPEIWPSGYDPEINLVLNYAKEFTEADHGKMNAPRPFGISGGGIWQSQLPLTKIWAAEYRLKLVGFQHEWLGKSTLLIGSKIKYLIDEIKKADTAKWPN